MSNNFNQPTIQQLHSSIDPSAFIAHHAVEPTGSTALNTQDSAGDAGHNLNENAHRAAHTARDYVRDGSDRAYGIARKGTNNAYYKGKSMLDAIWSPESRRSFRRGLDGLVREQPLLVVRSSPPLHSSWLLATCTKVLQSFAGTQLVANSLPVATFLAFSGGVIAFSVTMAVLFSMFWISCALLVLLPVLFVTSSIGVMFWLWAVGSFVTARWLYRMVPVSVTGRGEVRLPTGSLVKNGRLGDEGRMRVRVEKGEGLDVKAKIENGV